ncbi:MAG: class I adenylate-forming enzyme family protein [Clostridia bacterium]
MLTVGNALSASVRRHRDKTALIFGDRALTFNDFDSRVNRFAQALMAEGVQPGDRVALLLPNGLTMAEAYFATARAGAVAVPINVRWAAPEIRYVLEDSGPRLVIAGEEFRDALPEAPNILIGDRWEEKVQDAPDADPAVAVSETDPWVIVYTSGTTGRPKGAVRDHRSNVMIALILVAELGITSDDVGMALLPMFHVNSMWFVTLSLAIGATCVVYPHRTFHPGHVVEELNRTEATYSMFVPSMLSFLADAAERGALDPRHLRVAMTSSAPLDAALRDRLLRVFPRANLYDIYGATEYGGVTMIRHQTGGPVGTVGWPAIGQTIRIFRDDYTPTATGEVGEVGIAGPTLMREYWKRPEETAAAFHDGFLTLGDMGYLDEAGRLVLVDRKQDMIIVAGENVYPSEVEGVLVADPSVALAACIGLRDERRGESVVAAVVPLPGQTVDVERLHALCRDNLADYKRPRTIEVWPELPLGPAGKVVRRLVRQQWVQRAAGTH